MLNKESGVSQDKQVVLPKCSQQYSLFNSIVSVDKEVSVADWLGSGT